MWQPDRAPARPDTGFNATLGVSAQGILDETQFGAAEG